MKGVDTFPPRPCTRKLRGNATSPENSHHELLAALITKEDYLKLTGGLFFDNVEKNLGVDGKEDVIEEG